MQQTYTEKNLSPGDDLADAFAVRQDVFVDEQGFDLMLEFDDIDPAAHHVVLYDGEQPVATGRVFPTDGDGLYAIGRVAVRSAYRGGTDRAGTDRAGTGRLLMERLETLARSLNARAVTLGAQCRVRGFYEKLGYAAYGEEYLDEHCPHIHMRKSL